MALNVDSVRSFFSDFLEEYAHEVEKNYSDQKDKLTLFNSRPVKLDIMIDRNLQYGAILLSKSQRTELKVDTSFQDPMIVIAAANAKKYEYGEQRVFLYVFQINEKRFSTWNVPVFVKDFIEYELTKDNFK